MYALPIILQESHLDVEASTTMLMNLAFGFVGICLAVPVSASSHSRLGLFCGVMLGRAMCISVFFLGLWHKSDNEWALAITLSGIFGKTMLDSIAFVLVYLYAIEVRGTESRASSSGMALAVGRLGGVIAPVMFETFPYGAVGFVGSVCVLAFACAALTMGLPIETKDRQLGEIAAESAPLA